MLEVLVKAVCLKSRGGMGEKTSHPHLPRCSLSSQQGWVLDQARPVGRWECGAELQSQIPSLVTG